MKRVKILIWIPLFYMGLEARKSVFRFCEQQRCRPFCASTHSDQPLCYLLIGIYHTCIFTCYKRNFIFFASPCSWAGWFGYDHVENPEDRFSCDETHIGIWILCAKIMSLQDGFILLECRPTSSVAAGQGGPTTRGTLYHLFITGIWI